MAGSISVEQKTARILAAFLAFEGGFVAYYYAANGARFLAYLGLAAGREGSWPGWLLALAVTAIFVAYSARMPSVRANLVKPSWLKLLALPMALSAGVLEEAVFRSTLMNALQHQGAGVAVQILISGLAFGVVHGIWGLFGRSAQAAVGATVVTGVLGTFLAVVYVAAGRSLLPCIAAHAMIDALIEPGMVLAACRGEMSRLRSVAD
jgi:membrane protease YdiL (CAAX protease family)